MHGRVLRSWLVLQLADFGLSRVLETNATHISTNTIGTIAYQPEEVRICCQPLSQRPVSQMRSACLAAACVTRMCPQCSLT